MSSPRETGTPHSRRRVPDEFGSPRHHLGRDVGRWRVTGRAGDGPEPGPPPASPPGPSDYPPPDSAPDIETWRETLRNAIFQLDATPRRPAGDPGHAGAAPKTAQAGAAAFTEYTGYTGWVDIRSYGDVIISNVASDPVRVARTPRLITRNPIDLYLLLIAVRPSHAASGSHRTLLRPGDAVLVDSTQPYALTADAFGHYVSIHVPRGALRRDLRAPLVPGRVIAAEDPTLRVLRAVVSELARGPRDPAPASPNELGHTAYELLVSTLRPTAGTSSWGSDVQLSRRAQLVRMREFVRIHLAEPNLSPRMLAAAFGVSPRYVGLVFREGDGTPAGFIRETRLEEARRRLADPRQRHQPVSAVAKSVGFTDPGVLARGFRSRYGITPSEYRRHGLAAASEY